MINVAWNENVMTNRDATGRTPNCRQASIPDNRLMIIAIVGIALGLASPVYQKIAEGAASHGKELGLLGHALLFVASGLLVIVGVAALIFSCRLFEKLLGLIWKKKGTT